MNCLKFSSHCGGECGATEEHFLQFDPEDTVVLRISSKEVFSSAGHYPLVAGHTASGLPLYIHNGAFMAAIRNGTSWSSMRFQRCYSDRRRYVSFPDPLATMNIMALKYDPETYPRSEGYMDNARDERSMNSAGPYLWTFNRKLPIQEKLWSGEGSILPPRLLWVDTLM